MHQPNKKNASSSNPQQILSSHIHSLKSRKRKQCPDSSQASNRPSKTRKHSISQQRIFTSANILRVVHNGVEDITQVTRRNGGNTISPAFESTNGNNSRVANGTMDSGGDVPQQEGSQQRNGATSIVDGCSPEITTATTTASSHAQNTAQTVSSRNKADSSNSAHEDDVYVVENPIVDSNLCTICLEPMHTHGKHKITSTPCGHCFGYTCILSWVSKGKRQCPICKSPISADSLVPLYLVESVHPLVTQHHQRELRDQVQSERQRLRQQRSLSKSAIKTLEEFRAEIVTFIKTGTFPGQLPHPAPPVGTSNLPGTTQNNVIEVIDSDEEDTVDISMPSQGGEDHTTKASEHAIDFLLHLQKRMDEKVEKHKCASLRINQDRRRKFRPYLEFDLKTNASLFDFCGITGSTIVYDSKSCVKSQKQGQITWFSTVANREETIVFPELSADYHGGFRFTDLRGGMISQSSSPFVATASMPDNKVRLIDIDNAKQVCMEYSCPYEPSTMHFSNSSGNYLYVGTEMGSVIQLDVRNFGETVSEIRLPSHDYHKDQPVTSIALMPNKDQQLLCSKGASGLVAVNFSSNQFSCHPVTFPTLKRRSHVFYNFNVSYNGQSNLWSSSYVSHRSTQISVDSIIFEMPCFPSAASQDTFAITSDVSTKHPPVLLQVPSYNFPTEKHPTIMQQTGYEKHDLRIPIVFDSENWDSSTRTSPFIALAQNRNVLLYDCNEGHVVQNLDLTHSSYIECMRRFVTPDLSLIGVISQNKLSLSRLQ